MSSEKLFFSTLKEGRGSYFVEYKPPNPGFQYTTLNLVFPNPVTKETVAATMEREVGSWLLRYPVPVMAHSFDEKEDLIDLTPVRPCSYLIGFGERASGEIQLSWRHLENEQIPVEARDPNYLKAVYPDIPWKTEDSLRRSAEREAKNFRKGWLIVMLWLTLLPATWEVLQWAGPAWLATVVMLYGLWRAFKKAMILSGKWKKSHRQLLKDDEERRMKHYFYHCEMNPEGFMRLKAENFEREAREDVRKEASELNHPLKLKSDTDK